VGLLIGRDCYFNNFAAATSRPVRGVAAFGLGGLLTQIDELAIPDRAHHARALVQTDVVLRARGDHAVRHDQFVRVLQFVA
jgi:hypothetical protein